MADQDDIGVLHDRLDALWIQYLGLLDEHTTAQANIKKDMAAGFFSLTQANFKSSGRRFGQDHYDDRTVATTRVRVDDDNNAISLQITDFTPPNPATDDIKQSGKEGPHDQRQDPIQLPSPDATPEPEITVQPEKHATAEDDTLSPTKPKINPHDPIRWFGILVPPTLREAQNSFRHAVQNYNGVGQAATASRGMRETEAEIRKLRKLLKKAEKDASSAKAADD